MRLKSLRAGSRKDAVLILKGNSKDVNHNNALVQVKAIAANTPALYRQDRK